MDHPPAIVVSTGRCGSTLLSNMVRRHPRLLSASELFFCVRPEGFPDGPIDGNRFWALLAEPRPSHTLMLSHRLIPDEMIYPIRPGMRFGPDAGIPPILLVTLPHLTDDPDALFDELGAFVTRRPSAPAADHYRALLGWLCDRFGRDRWVERSGGSLRDLPALLEHLPDARYVHAYRDGRETAMSMARHHSFRMIVLRRLMEERIGLDPFTAQDRPAEALAKLPAEWEPLLPERFDPTAFRQLDLPIEAFGALWSAMITQGLDLLDTLPPDRVLPIRYEALVRQPEPELRRFVAFLGPEAADDAWLAESAALCRSKPPTWTALPDDARARLEAACAPGLERLGYPLGTP